MKTTWKEYKKTLAYLTTDIFEFICSDGTEFEGIPNDTNIVEIKQSDSKYTEVTIWR